MIYTARCFTPVGKIFLAENDGRLLGLWIEGQKYFFESFSPMIEEKQTPVLIQAEEWLARYFSGGKPKISELSLFPAESEFRQNIRKILCEIPYGETVTYGEIAACLTSINGKGKMSAQAVGGALAHNRIPIIVPCHRVVGANGSLTGYAGGIDSKIKLLTHEGVDMTHLFVPVKAALE